MEFLGSVVAWFADPAHWRGDDGIPTRLLEHVQLIRADTDAGILTADVVPDPR